MFLGNFICQFYKWSCSLSVFVIIFVLTAFGKFHGSNSSKGVIKRELFFKGAKYSCAKHITPNLFNFLLTST